MNFTTFRGFREIFFLPFQGRATALARRLTVAHSPQSVFPHGDMLGAITTLTGGRTGTGKALMTLRLRSAFFLTTACLAVCEKEHFPEQ
jgi:hypothetical protein